MESSSAEWVRTVESLSRWQGAGNLRFARAERMKQEFHELGGYWSHVARARGILTEKDLELYLEG